MAASRVCPICNRPLSEEAQAVRFRPFCSRRCADIDLGRWLKGAYAIPAAAELDDETETDAMLPEDGRSKPGPPASGAVPPRRIPH